jgi:hypothetical protein
LRRVGERFARGDRPVKNISALLLTVMLAAASRGAAAQEALGDAMSDLPPALGMPGDERNDLPLGDGADVGGELEPQAEDISSGILIDDEGAGVLGEPMRWLAACPSLFESSGTWLRRGFWYGEADFMWMNRGWDKHGLTLARREEVVLNVTGQPPASPGVSTALLPYIVGNYLNLEGHGPGASGLGRVRLGRFLFRDGHNRDHSFEGAIVVGQPFSQFAEVTDVNGLQVSDFIDRGNSPNGGNPSFDGDQRMNAAYESTLTSGEANYIVRSRMHRDRMELRPDGNWVRTATPTRTYSFLTGVRVLSLTEDLTWNSFSDATDTNPRGLYQVNTSNTLVGTQIGGSLGHETARWSVTGSTKAGAYLNSLGLSSAFFLSLPNGPAGGAVEGEYDMSFVGEASLTAKWHLRPNVSLRSGLEVLFVDGIALAPHQINFVPGTYRSIAHNGDSVFLGASLGLESYW